MASTARWRRTRRAMAHDAATTRTGRFIYANGVARRARATRRRGEGADDATIVRGRHRDVTLFRRGQVLAVCVLVLYARETRLGSTTDEMWCGYDDADAQGRRDHGRREREQARIAEEAGAVAVMALERVPADIRKDGGVARMSDPTMIKAIKEAVTIPVMAKARIGHFVEAQVLEAVGIDYIDESEVLTPADEINHLNKHKFKVPVLCGCRDLGEALRRIAEGSSMIRTKGEAGTGNVVEAVRHCRAVMGDIRRLCAMDEDEVFVYAKEIRAPLELVQQTRKLGRLPVVNFAAGGVATPADAALMMQLGMDGVFVGSGIFKSGDPAKRARAIVQAVTHYNDPKIIAEVSQGLGEAMVGIDCKEQNFVSYAGRSE